MPDNKAAKRVLVVSVLEEDHDALRRVLRDHPDANLVPGSSKALRRNGGDRMLAVSDLRYTGRFRQPKVDRRIRERFPVKLDARYKIVDEAGAHTGLAKTMNVSRSGVLLEAEIAAAVGRRVELSLYWPVQLDGKCGLQLVISGHVIWCNGTRIGIQTDKHHGFRTTGIKRLADLAHHKPDSTGRLALVHPRTLSTSGRAVPSGNAPDRPLAVLRRVER